MGTLDVTKAAYEEILKVMFKHRDVCDFDIRDFEEKSKTHIFGVELKEVYGFDINPQNIKSLDYVVLGKHAVIMWMGAIHNRTISWSDNGEQPTNELLLAISFPTGAYIFGNHYPNKLFERMFRELVDLKPKYIDTNNSCIYFSMENASSVYKQFGDILEKYHKYNKEEYRLNKIQKLKEELNELESK